MASKLDNLLPAILGANDAGLTVGAIRAKFIGKSNAKAKDREAELRERLASLVREGAIWGPLKHGVAQYYFTTSPPAEAPRSRPRAPWWRASPSNPAPSSCRGRVWKRR